MSMWQGIQTARRGCACAAIAAPLAALLAAAPAPALTFIPLGDLVGGDFNSTALGVSNDGTTVVGTSDATLDFEAFRWTEDTGMLSLGDLAGGGFESTAHAVSGDGSQIAGFGTTPTGAEAATWSAPLYVPSGLGSLGGTNPTSVANGISADGSVVVGRTTTASGTEAFLWTAGGGMISLGDFTDGGTQSVANAVSDDGTVVVGRGLRVGPATEAFLWTAGSPTDGTGLVGLGDLAGGTFDSRALGVSGDGTTVVGASQSANGLEAFVWTVGSGMQGLGDLAGGDFTSTAHDASADGSVIVGFGTADDGQHAVLWNASGLIFDLNAIAAAVLPAGWLLEEAFGVSADGLTIVGRGSNADGNDEAWILRMDFVPVPEPHTGLLTALGLIAFCAARRRG